MKFSLFEYVRAMASNPNNTKETGNQEQKRKYGNMVQERINFKINFLF